MTTAIPNPQGTCSTCGAPLSPTMRHCPTCKTDAGAPNVRACRSDENLKALEVRFNASRERADEMGCSKEFNDLEAVVKDNSGVVVSIPAAIARRLFEDPESLYTNYEQLVGGKIRKPAEPSNDRHRRSVGGLLFGSYADYIVYGALSLTEEGLPTYGAVHCRLRSVTIDMRTSFLETNSYRFVNEHHIVAGKELPVGYMACWTYRYCLVLAKLTECLSKGQTESDWQAIVIQSDGKDRKNDNFIEAHIYEGFDRNAIESMTAATGLKLTKEERLDLDIAKSRFSVLAGKTK